MTEDCFLQCWLVCAPVRLIFSNVLPFTPGEAGVEEPQSHLHKFKASVTSDSCGCYFWFMLMTPRRKSDQGDINQTEINTEHQGTNSISWNSPYKLQEARRQFPRRRQSRFMLSSDPGAGEMLEVEGDGSALHAIKNLCLSGLSNCLWAALGGCHKSAHPCVGDRWWEPSWFIIIFRCISPSGTTIAPQPHSSPNGRATG